MAATTVHIDFETRSAVDLKKVGADTYAQHSSTDVLCLAWAVNNDPPSLWKPSSPPPIDLFLEVLDGATVKAHNAPFELVVWNHVCEKRYGWEPLPASQVQCTMAMCYAMSLPGALENAALAMGLKAQKDMDGNRVMQQLSKPRSMDDDGKNVVWWDRQEFSEKYERLYSYCVNDVIVERELDHAIMALSAEEQDLWQIDFQINREGIQIDLPAARTAIALVELEKARHNTLMREITQNEVPTCASHAALARWVNSRGVKTESVAKAEVADILEDSIFLPEDVERALRLRQDSNKSSTAKLQAMMNRAGADGRVRGALQFCGAGTGRWSGRGIQVQNFPRPKISQEQIDNVFQILEGVNNVASVS